MLIKKVEYHTVHSHFDYDIPDEDIIAEFGSVEEFEKHFEEESDAFYEFVMEYGPQRHAHWRTDDRKGGYEVEWSYGEE
jgi:hypothetical protein